MSEGVNEVSERVNKRSGGRAQSEQSGASARVSSANERANGRASGPVLQSVFLVVLAQSARKNLLEGFFGGPDLSHVSILS